MTQTVQELRRRVVTIPNVNIDTSPSALTQAVRQIPKLSVRYIFLLADSDALVPNPLSLTGCR